MAPRKASGTWFRVSNTWPDHPKMAGLTDAAVAAWFRALAYCSRHLTDGHIPHSAIGGIGQKRTIERLVIAGCLDEVPTGFVVVSYTEHQATREEVEANRERERNKKRKQRKGSEGEHAPVSPRDKAGSPVGSPADVPGLDTDTDTDTPPTPQREAVIAAAAEAVMQRRGSYDAANAPGIHSKDRWLRSVRTAVVADLAKQPKLNELVAKGATPDRIADLIEPRTVPAVRPPAHDPDCPECGSPEGWKLDERGEATRCTRQRLRAVQ